MSFVLTKGTHVEDATYEFAHVACAYTCAARGNKALHHGGHNLNTLQQLTMLNFNQQKINEHQFHSLTLFHINQNEE